MRTERTSWALGLAVDGYTRNLDWEVNDGRVVTPYVVEAIGGEPTPEEVAAFLAPPVPASVTMRQARLALLQAGHLAAVTAALAATPGMAGEAARIEWEYASTLERDSVLVQAFAAQLGLSGAALDALFTTAASL